MESVHGKTIVTSGRHKAAGKVIGVNPCGYNPTHHDGRSVSVQTRGHGTQSISPPIDLCGDGERSTVDLALLAYRLPIRRAIAQRSVADPRQFIGQGAGRFVGVRASLHLGNPVAQPIETLSRLPGHARNRHPYRRERLRSFGMLSLRHRVP